MNILDIVFCIIIALLAIRGVFRGLVRETASILGLVLGFVLANSFYAELSPRLEELLGCSPGLASLAAYLGIFLGVMAAIFLLASLVRKILKLIMLGWLDSLGGGALGAFKGALLCSIIVMALTTFLPSRAGILVNSRLLPYVNEFNDLLSDVLPQEMRDQFLTRSRELQKEWEQRLLDQLKERQSDGKK